jgi:hypothetical protein
MHGERIRARAEAKAKAQRGQADGRQTSEIYAERALAGARADEALRRQAEENARRARGEWVPGDGPEDVEEEYDVVEEYDEETDDEDEEPKSTAEIYARRERERIKAERAANLRAQAGAVQTMGQQGGHRYAHVWDKPAS